MKEFLESREFKKIQINLGLSILLLSLVTTIKGVFNSANSFQLLECLSIGVSAFLISFMGIFGNENYFNDLKELYNKKSKREKSLLLMMPIIFLFLVLVFNYLFIKLPIFLKWLDEVLDLPQLDSLTTKITEINIYFVTLLWNFSCYIIISMMISMELTFIGIIFFDRISEYYSQIGDKKINDWIQKNYRDWWSWIYRF